MTWLRRAASALAYAVWLLAGSATAQTNFTIATYAPEMTRKGPGLLLRDLARGEDQRLSAALDLITNRAADVILLTGVDWDAGRAALSEIQRSLRMRGLDYPHSFTAQPNRGLATGIDLDGDGRLGGPDDAQGWGPFTGSGGLAVLSRWPIDADGLIDFTPRLWAEMLDAQLPVTADGSSFLSPEALQIQRLSTTNHWVLPLQTPWGSRLHIAVFSATAPVFDGPEDRNGLRNADEIALFAKWLDGRLDSPVPDTPVIVMGRANLDPSRGAGRHAALRALTAHARLNDAIPRTPQGAAATARYDLPPDGPGPLRLDYVLPDSRLQVRDAGIDWPQTPSAKAKPDQKPLRAGLVWVELTAPD